MSNFGEITQLLRQLSEEQGPDQEAVLEQLMPLVYRELKELARASRYRWTSEPDPSTTSLVHEAYIKLSRLDHRKYANRQQFYGLASRAMRSIVVDNARWHRRLKRGGGKTPSELEESTLVSAGRSEELLALDEALDRLDDREPRLARIVECRCFGGLTIQETADALEVAPATVKRDWSLARAWLFRELKAAPDLRSNAAR